MIKNILNCFLIFIFLSGTASAQNRELDPRALDPDKLRNDDVYLNTSNVSKMLYNAYYDSTEKIYRYFPYSFADSSGFAESWEKVISLWVNYDKTFFEDPWQLYLEDKKPSTFLIFNNATSKAKISFKGGWNPESKKNVKFEVYPKGRVFKDAVLIVQNDPDSAMLYALDLSGNKQEMIFKCSGNIGKEIAADMGRKMLTAPLTGNRLLLLDLTTREAAVIEGVSLPFDFKICKGNNSLAVFSEGKYDNVKPDVTVYTIDLGTKKLVSTDTWKGLQYLPDRIAVTNNMQYVIGAKKGSVKLYSMPGFTFLTQVISPQLMKECHIVDSMDVAFMTFNKNITVKAEADIAKYQKQGFAVKEWYPDFKMSKDLVYKYMLYCAGGGTPYISFDVFTNLGNRSGTSIREKTPKAKPVERFTDENIVRFEADLSTTEGYYGTCEPRFEADNGTLDSYYNFHRPYQVILMVKKKTEADINTIVLDMPREEVRQRPAAVEDASSVKKKSAPAGKIECPACGGTGEKTGYNSKKCSSCNGGKVRCTICGGGGRVYTRDRSRSEYCQYCHGAGSTTCYSCGGKGSTSTTSSASCKSCNGTGYIGAGAPKK